MKNNVYFGLFLQIFTLWTIAQKIEQRSFGNRIPDKIELNLDTNCVTANSMSATRLVQNVLSLNLPSKINILKAIQESCAKSEKIYATHSGSEKEYNQDELLPLNFPFNGNQKLSGILANLTLLSNYGNNFTSTFHKDLATLTLAQYEAEKSATLAYLRKVLDLRMERVRAILKSKLGAHVTIFQPGLIYDRTEINDFLSTIDIPHGYGYKFYSYTQLENAKNELKEVSYCSQLGYGICSGQKSCIDFFNMFTDTVEILFQSTHLTPLYNQLNSDVTLFYNLHVVKKGRGKRGKDGQRGSQGPIGRRGYSGAKGDKGDKGEQGYRGDDGAMGLHGLNIAQQIGYPTCFKKQCPDNSTSEITNTTKVSLKGLKGNAGDIGSKGERGFQGIKGSKGLTLAKGEIIRLKLIKGSKGLPAISSSNPVMALPKNSVNINDIYWSNTFRTLLFERIEIDKKKATGTSASNSNTTSTSSLPDAEVEKKPKKRSASKLSKEELLRLYEMRRSLKIRFEKRKEKEKLPSGIVADYTASLFANLNYTDDVIGVAPVAHSDSSEASSGAGFKMSAGAMSSPVSIDDMSTATSTDSLSVLHDCWTFDKLNSLLDIVNMSSGLRSRIVQIHRQNRFKNDFGFLLRRATAVNQNVKQPKTNEDIIIFAEPGKNENIGLLPGDHLLEINGVPVTNATRDDIIDRIRSSKDFVTLKVEPVLEVSEISNRCLDECQNSVKCLTGLLRGSKYKAPISNSGDETDDCTSDQYWLVHKNGYSAVRKVHDIETNSDQVAVRYQNDGGNGNLMFVDENFLERKSLMKDCFVDNLVALNFLNETNVVHTLRQRYASNLLYTFLGSNLIALKPYIPVSIYSDKMASLFKGCKLSDCAAHIYAMAQSVYYRIRTQSADSCDQSIIVQGRRSSDKAVQVKHLLEYFSDLQNQSFLTKEQLSAIFLVLEVIGCSQFGQVFRLGFEPAGNLVAFNVQQFLVDKYIVYLMSDRVPVFEYFIVNQSQSHQQQSRNEYYLSGAKIDEFLSKKSQDQQRKAHCEFVKFQIAMNRLNVSEHELKAVWQLLAAIFHLKHVSVVRNSVGKSQFNDRSSVQNACSLLGLNFEHFSRHVFGSNSSSSKLNNVQDHLMHFVGNLFVEFVNLIIYFINRNFSPKLNAGNLKWVYVVKVPHLRTNKSARYLSLHDLFNNYFLERFQNLFLQKHLLEPVDRLKTENVEYDGLIDTITIGQNLTKLIGSKSRNSLFSILDEESTEAAVVDRVEKLTEAKDNRMLLYKVTNSNDRLVLQHCQATCPVSYSVSGWFRDHCKITNQKLIGACLQDSSNEMLKKLISDSRYLNSIGFGNKLRILENNSLLRISSLRRSSSSGSNVSAGGSSSGASNSTLTRKSASVCYQMKLIADNLLSTLEQTQTHFVFCLETDGLNASDGYVNVALLRQQISNFGLVNVLRFYKQGYPDSLLFEEFMAMFSVKKSLVADDRKLDEANLIKEIMQWYDIDESQFKIGTSKVLFRHGILNSLERKRNENLAVVVTHLQAVCRGFLARKAYEKTRVQDVAIRCVQKNVRAFFSVRSWSWWRLLMQIKPVLNIHRIEDELQAKTKDLELLMDKVDRVEDSNSRLKAENDKLVAQISELTLDLVEERSSSALLAEKLEHESSQRLSLEERLLSTLNENRSLEQEKNELKDELDCMKSLDCSSNDANEDTGQNIYKKRLEHSVKEIGFLKKRIQEQHECDLEQMIGLKKQLEKKLSDAYEEIDEQRQVASQWKKKFNKTVDEISDMKLLLEQQSSRNSQLEKKQKKFDQELLVVMDDLRKEKTFKDRFHREREIIAGEKYLLESTISDLRIELESKEEKIDNLQKELDEASTMGLSSAEILVLKRQKADLEKRVKELEEELDEMAGQMHMLEQNKVRLEMNLEHVRRENRIEVAQKEDEIENLRSGYQKKLKNVEIQIEAEREERSALIREKRELERRLENLIEIESNEHVGDKLLVNKLKRNLKRLLMLYNDVKLELDLCRNDGKNKVVIRQLKNKVEDLECDLQTTTKMRQNLEYELAESQTQLEETKRAKNDADSRLTILNRQLVELQIQLEESEEEFNDLQKKYENQIEKITKDSQISRQHYEIESLESDEQKSHLIEHLTKLTSELESLVLAKQEESNVEEIRMRTKELESKLEVEQMKRSRHETQISRLKESVDKLQADLSAAKAKEKQVDENMKRVQKTLKETKDELMAANSKVSDLTLKKAAYEKKIENLEAELLTNRTDLKMALKRVDDLQVAIRNDLEDLEEDCFDDFCDLELSSRRHGNSNSCSSSGDNFDGTNNNNRSDM